MHLQDINRLLNLQGMSVAKTPEMVDNILVITLEPSDYTQQIINVRRNYVEKGIDAAIFRQKRETPPVPAKVTGDVEAHIIAVCCSAPPEGKEHWSMKMIADKIVLDA